MNSSLFQSARARGILLAVASVVALALLVRSVGAVLQTAAPFINADGIYPFVLATDHDYARAWTISPAPSYPDLLVMWILTPFGASLRGTHDTYAVLFAMALTAATYRAQRAFALPRAEALLAALLGVAATYGAAHVPTRAHEALYLPAFHATTLLVTLLGVAAVASFARDDRPSLARAAAGGALLGALGCGDSMLLSQLVLPILVLLACGGAGLALARAFRIRLACFTASLVIAFVAAGAVLARLGPSVPETGYALGSAELGAGLLQLRLVLGGDEPPKPWTTELKSVPFVALVLLFLVSAVALLTRDLRRGRARPSPMGIGVLFTLLVMGASLAVPIVMGLHTQHFNYRYSLATLLFPALLATAPLRLLAPAHEGRARAIVLSLVAITAMWFGLASPPRVREDFAPGGEAQHVTDRVSALAARGIRVGYAQYWKAKPLAASAGNGVRISALDNLGIGWWLGNADWPLERDAQTGRLSYPERVFVYDEDLRPGSVDEVFGAPESVEDVGRGRLLVFPFDGRRYGILLRDLCTTMALRGLLCAPARGELDLCPLLEEKEGALRGLGFSLPNGRYALRLETSGVGHVALEARLDDALVTPDDFRVTSGRPLHDSERLRVVIRHDASVTCRALRLAPL